MAKKTKPSTDSVVITMLVDESGSMGPIAQPTRNGFNEYVESLQENLKGTNVYFSAIKFDTRGVRKLQVGASIKYAVKLSTENYMPQGGTPLLDAIGKTIEATDDVVSTVGATKIIVVIQTDGEENSSVEYDLSKIKTMIEFRQGREWQFVFLGAGINAFADAAKMGIVGARTMSYGHNEANTRHTFRATASNSAQYASGLAATMDFCAAQSEAAGESPDITLAKLANITTKVETTIPLNKLSLKD